MTVRELMEVLRDYDPEAEVRVAQDSHDHWRTTLARPLDTVSNQLVVFSRYHEFDVVVDEDDEDAVDGTNAVILSHGAL